MKTEGLRLLTTIPTAPTTLYLAWLSSEQHSAMSGGTAKIDPNVGAKYTAQNGYITGKLVVLDLGRRIVMSWRTSDFPRDAADSRVEVQLEALGASTRMLVLHTEIPEGMAEKFRSYWAESYFTPMRVYFSKYLPDPRKPPPPRRPMPPMEEEEEATPAKKGKGGKVVPPAKPSKGAKAPPPSAKAAPPSKGPKPAAPAKKAAPPPKPKMPAKPAKPAPAAPATAGKKAPPKATAKRPPGKKAAAKPAKSKPAKKKK